MRENLFVFGVAVLIIVVGAGVTHFTVWNTECPPIETRARLMVCDPEFYVGRKVKLSTEGMERVEDTLVYRSQANKQPSIVCNITPSDPLPAYVVGICDRRQDGVIIIDKCTFSR